MSAPIITKGQAACYLFGEDMTTENKQRLKQIINNDPNYELVYCPDTGMRRPMAIGRKVVTRDPLLYRLYPDSDSDDNTNDNNNDSLVEEELHSSQESGSSITCEDYDYVVRKAGILDFLKRTMATEQPPEVSQYDQKFVNVQDLFLTLQMYIPKMDTTYNAGQVSRWMCNEPVFGKTKVVRAESTVVNGRMLWILKAPYMDMISKGLFNVNTFRKTIMKMPSWITVGYARKSNTKESVKSRQRLVQEMVNILHSKTLCSNVYVSVICSSSSPLSTRDANHTPASLKLQNRLRRINGDFHDFIVLLQTTQTKVRLVVLDFAGLSTSVGDLMAFVKKHRMLKEIVVDLGHTLVTLSRQELLSGKVNDFNCRAGCVQRSKLD